MHETIDAAIDLRRAMQRLTPQQRAAFGLAMAGMTQRQVARALGVSQPNVCYILQRALCNLRAATLCGDDRR